MKITLYMTEKRREAKLREILTSGFERHGETVDFASVKAFDDYREFDKRHTDIAVFVGVKSKDMYETCLAAGVIPMLIDKGYVRSQLYYRVSLGGYQPPYFDELDFDDTRFKTMKIPLKPRRLGGTKVIFAGSSHKYCQFHELGNVNEYARTVCAEINHYVNGRKKVVYRPKPSWWQNKSEKKNRIAPERRLPPNVEFSHPSRYLRDELYNTFCLVTHGSNSALEALVNGVPVVMLSEKGVNPAWPLCEHNIKNVLNPFWPDDRARLKVFSNLAWCQFTESEIANGLMWSVHRQWAGLAPQRAMC